MRAFEKMVEIRKQKGKPFRFRGDLEKDYTAKDVFNWWMEYDVLPGQFNLFEDYEEDEDE